MQEVIGNVRSWDLFLVAVGLGFVIVVQGLWFQMKLREKEAEIQRMMAKIIALEDAFRGMTAPKMDGLMQ